MKFLLEAQGIAGNLMVSDEVTVGFFSAVVIGQTTAIMALWKKCCECERNHREMLERIGRMEK